MCSGGGMAVSIPACRHIRSRVVCGDRGPRSDDRHDPEEETKEAKERNAPQLDHSSNRQSLRIVDIAAWHALTTQEVLREEGDVRADEHHPEVDFAAHSGYMTARHLWQVEVDPGEDRETAPKAHHIVEVRNHVVGVVIGAVDRACDRTMPVTPPTVNRKRNPWQKHRCLEFDRAAPHRGDPAEDFHPGGHRDDHRGQHEIGLLCQRHAHRVHVVCPNDEAQSTDAISAQTIGR